MVQARPPFSWRYLCSQPSFTVHLALSNATKWSKFLPCPASSWMKSRDLKVPWSRSVIPGYPTDTEIWPKKRNWWAATSFETTSFPSFCLEFFPSNTGKKRPLIVQIIWQVRVVHWWALQSFAHIEPHILHKPITKEPCPFKNYVSHLTMFIDCMMFDYTFRFPKENDLNLWFMMLVNALSFHWSPRDL